MSGGSRAPGGGRGKCRSCDAPIIWFKTSAGKNIPINAETVLAEDYTLEIPRHVAHFATCPNAAKHRKPR